MGMAFVSTALAGVLGEMDRQGASCFDKLLFLLTLGWRFGELADTLLEMLISGVR